MHIYAYKRHGTAVSHILLAGLDRRDFSIASIRAEAVQKVSKIYVMQHRHTTSVQ